MERKRLFSIGFPIVLVLLAACTTTTGVPPASLDGTEWVLESLGADEPIPGTKLTARFDEGSVGGSSGCNSYGGSYRTDGKNLEVGELTSTLMACLDPEGAMDQEAEFLRILGAAEIYQIIEGKLLISSADGGQLTFVAGD